MVVSVLALVSHRLSPVFLHRIVEEAQPMSETTSGRPSARRSSGKIVLYVLRVALLILAPVALLAGDEHNPYANDPKAAKAGESEFRINCALCHGLGARGGGRGPDLTRAQKKHVHSDTEMF